MKYFSNKPKKYLNIKILFSNFRKKNIELQILWWWRKCFN